MTYHFKLLDFNYVRHSRGAPAARVEISEYNEEINRMTAVDWLWMSKDDLINNIADQGEHPELLKALSHYG